MEEIFKAKPDEESEEIELSMRGQTHTASFGLSKIERMIYVYVH